MKVYILTLNLWNAGSENIRKLAGCYEDKEEAKKRGEELVDDYVNAYDEVTFVIEEVTLFG